MLIDSPKTFEFPDDEKLHCEIISIKRSNNLPQSLSVTLPAFQISMQKMTNYHATHFKRTVTIYLHRNFLGTIKKLFRSS